MKGFKSLVNFYRVVCREIITHIYSQTKKYIPTTLKMSPAERLVTGEVRKCTPHVGTGGICSTRWSPILSDPTLLHAAPENTATGEVDWILIPDKSTTRLCICRQNNGKMLLYMDNVSTLKVLIGKVSR